MSEEWGPWIEHDGRGCPVPVGTWVKWESEHAPGRIKSGEDMARGGRSWDWRFWGIRQPDGKVPSRILRYRIRKPRALRELINMVENLPAPERVDT